MAEQPTARKMEVLTPVQMDPQALIAKAIDKGAAIDTVERLVALAKDLRDVQARDAWYAAMAEFQQQCPPIKKTSTARIQSARGNYSYSYAPLDEIMAAITPVMAPLGLSVSWRIPKVEHGAVLVSCRIAHRMGHHEDSGDLAMPIGDDRGASNPAQRVASAITYAKRYTLLGILGLAPEDDDDAAAVALEQSQPTGRRRSNDAPYAPVRETFPSDEQADKESQALFGSEEEQTERAALNAEVQRLWLRLKIRDEQRKEQLRAYELPDDITTADLAALAGYVDYLRGRAGEPKRVSA